jgi:hypothetical protein
MSIPDVRVARSEEVAAADERPRVEQGMRARGSIHARVVVRCNRKLAMT